MKEKRQNHSDEPETERDRAFQQFLDFCKDKSMEGQRKIKEKVRKLFEMKRYK